MAGIGINNLGAGGIGEQFQHELGAAQGAQSAGAGGTGLDGVAISGDLVMEIYELRSQYINHGLESAIGQMKQAAAQSQALDDFKAALDSLPSDGTGGSDAAKWTEVHNAMQKAAEELPEGDPARMQMEGIMSSREMRGKDATSGLDDTSGAKFTDANGNQQTAPADYWIGGNDVKSMMDKADGIQKDIDTNQQELGMKVNQLMNEQQESATLFSGMQQAIHQSTMATISNIGKG